MYFTPYNGGKLRERTCVGRKCVTNAFRCDEVMLFNLTSLCTVLVSDELLSS